MCIICKISSLRTFKFSAVDHKECYCAGFCIFVHIHGHTYTKLLHNQQRLGNVSQFWYSASIYSLECCSSKYDLRARGGKLKPSCPSWVKVLSTRKSHSQTSKDKKCACICNQNLFVFSMGTPTAVQGCS